MMRECSQAMECVRLVTAFDAYESRPLTVRLYLVLLLPSRRPEQTELFVDSCVCCLWTDCAEWQRPASDTDTLSALVGEASSSR